MATQITKAEFEALPDSLKTKFKADGDNYSLIEEDVSGLRKNKDELLTELKELKAKYGDLDPVAAKAALEAQQKAAEADLEAKGKYDELLAQKEKAWSERFDTEKTEKEVLFSDVHRERLRNELVKRGSLPDRADYLVNDLIAETELFKNAAGKYDIRKKGGIGDAAEFDSMVEAIKPVKPFFFAASNTSGSGASGSEGNGGSTAKTMPVTQFHAMGVKEQAAFINSGGKPVE